ncbi:MAG: hypothetical protein KC493_15655 [Bacteriovoracaceae bacterium]|nr:hypothetical protein [Bacteriovoracaceae bacterium]
MLFRFTITILILFPILSSANSKLNETLENPIGKKQFKVSIGRTESTHQSSRLKFRVNKVDSIHTKLSFDIPLYDQLSTSSKVHFIIGSKSVDIPGSKIKEAKNFDYLNQMTYFVEQSVNYSFRVNKLNLSITPELGVGIGQNNLEYGIGRNNSVSGISVIHDMSYLFRSISAGISIEHNSGLGLGLNYAVWKNLDNIFIDTSYQAGGETAKTEVNEVENIDSKNLSLNIFYNF